MQQFGMMTYTSYLQVCLSLLGTWHGTDASQKWDPQNSNLFQILLSIQGMILISDPYFNEPNVERMRGQAEGNKASSSYNAEIHLNNIRSGSIFCICLNRTAQLRSCLKPSFYMVHRMHTIRHTFLAFMLQVMHAHVCAVWSAMTQPRLADWFNA